MSKYKLLVLALLFVPFISKGQLIDANKVPKTVKEAFEKRFPGVAPQWELEDGRFDAEFKEKGEKRSILFDRKGNSFEKLNMNINEIPTAMSTYIQQHYNGAPLKKARKIVASSGSITYLGIIKSMKLYFDGDGKFLEEKADEGNGD